YFWVLIVLPIPPCSTPFGIIGIFTAETDRSVRRGSRVLNAFRHHRNFHSSLACNRCSASVPCSTPFGIIGIFTSNATRPGCSFFFGAQRLSASSEFSLADPAYDTLLE